MYDFFFYKLLYYEKKGMQFNIMDCSNCLKEVEEDEIVE